MCLSILQGGPAPNFLSDEVVDYVLGKKLSPDAVKAKSFKSAVDKLVNAENDTEVREALASDAVEEVLNKIGYTGISQRETTSSVKSVIQSICLEDQIAQYLPSLLQLKSGLGFSCDFHKEITEQPQVWEFVFKSSNAFEITADEFLDDVQVRYSISCREKELEIDTFKYFSDVLESLNKENGPLKVNDLVKWITGSPNIPPLGFPQSLKVLFIHGCQQGCGCRPTASTCDTSIKLPVHINSEDTMKAMLESAVLESQGFGML